jgi:polysaccharide pyruvyl transferase WcaK-like protein
MDASFWFGQRLHPSVFASIHNIPFVGVEYQFNKMLDWSDTVEIDNFIRTDTATLEDFIEVHSRIEENMERLKRTLPRVIQNIRETANKIMDLV